MSSPHDSLRTTRGRQALQRLFGNSTRTGARSRPRRRALALENLEDRVTPTTAGVLSLSGSALVYTALNTGGPHQVNVTTSGAGLVINDTAGTILSVVPGLAGGTSTVSGAIPAAATVVSIQATSAGAAVNLGSGGSGLTLPAESLVVSANSIATLNSVTARAVTLNAGAGGNSLGSNLTATAGGLSINGPSTLTVNAILSAAGGDVNISGNLNSPAPNSLSINDAGGNVTSAGAVTGLSALTVAPARNITLGATSVTGPVVLTADNNVTLNGPLNDAGSTVTVQANWTGTGAGNFLQNVGGDIGGTPTAVTVQLNNGGGTGAAVVRGITTAPGGVVTVDARGTGTGGPVIDGNGPGAANVTTGTLFAIAGPGGINLDTSVTTLAAANVAGAPSLGQIAIRNTGGPLGVGPVSTANGPITISNNNVLNINSAVVAGGANQSVILTTAGPGSNVNFGSSGFSNATTGTLIVNSSGAITHAGVGDDIIARRVLLTAASGIGTSGAPIQVSTASLTAANSGTGDVFLRTTNGGGYGPTTAVVSNSASPGNVTLSQTGGQGLTATATTANGSVTVTNIGGSLTALNVASGNNQSVSLSTVGVGNLALGTVNAGSGVVNATSAAAITDLGNDGLNNVTAGTVNFVAATGVGSSGVNGSIETTAPVVTAANAASGGIFINSLFAGTTGFGTVAPGILAGGSGNVELRAAGAATLGGGASAVSTANGSVFASAAGLLTVNSVNTAAGNGAVTLQTTGGGNVQVGAGSVNAGAGTVTINSSGAILDSALAITAGTVNLTAVSAIGTSGAPVTTAAATVNASSPVAVWLSNPTGTVNYNTIVGGQIGITSGGPTTVTSASSSTASITVTVTGANNLTVGSITDNGSVVQLSTTGTGNIALGSVTGNGVVINSGGNVTGSGTTSPAAVNVTSPALQVIAASGVGTSAATGVNTLVPLITAQSNTGGVRVNSRLSGPANPVTFNAVFAITSGDIVLTATSDAKVGQGNVVLTNSGNVSVTDTAGQITFGNSVLANGGSVVVTGSGDVVLPAAYAIFGAGNVTVSGGTGSLAANINLAGTVTANSGSLVVNGGPAAFNTMTLSGTLSGQTGITVNGGAVGNNINVNGILHVFTSGGFTVNGGSGVDSVTFNPVSLFLTGNVAINAQASAATLNITDPPAGFVTGTFTIDFGVGHTTSDTLNIFGTGAALVPPGALPPTVPTGVTFTAGYTPWVLANFIVGQDHIPGFGY